MKQYQPLYLKYRPQRLSELIGQNVVTKTLTNAILYNKVVHAYLFCGPKGTGKTSTARILAKSLNCESGTTTTPCNKCTSCESIACGNSLDVIEIDAASHRKVEDAEDLINRVNLGTYGSRFKIYIIDEVHMLTDHAFNALLKTLEEPPKNVIFILATTEEYKVIPTITSRCQKLDFKPISQSDIEQKIKNIAKEEKINIDQTVIRFISRKSNGCLRDAISLLDQISVLQTDDQYIDSKEVVDLFGTVDRDSLFKLVTAILTFDRKNTLDLAESIIKSGKDIGELIKSLLELTVDLTKAKIDLNFKKALAVELNSDLGILNTIKQGHLLKIIEKLQDAGSKLRFALNQELQLMVEMMSMLDEDFLISSIELKERIEKLENNQSLELKPQSQEAITQHLAPNTQYQISDIQNSEHQNSKTSELQDLDNLWEKIVSLIESNPTRTLLTQSGGYLLNLTDDILEIGISKDMFLPRLEKDVKKKETILKAVKLATSLEPQKIKFRILPRQKEGKALHTSTELPNQELQITKIKTQTSNNEQSTGNGELVRAIEDLLEAKQVD